MFQVAIQQPLTAFHHLIGGDWGAENQHHSHDYVVEIIVEAEALDRHGYLFDIAEPLLSCGWRTARPEPPKELLQPLFFRVHPSSDPSDHRTA